MTPTDRFLSTLLDLRRGALADQLQTELTTVVAAVRATGAKGTLTLTLTIKPAAKGDVGTLMIDDDVKCKIPTAARGSTIMYATEANELSRGDPRQPKLDLDATVGPAAATPTAGPRPVDFRSRAANEDARAANDDDEPVTSH
jgi:hypothetical protein